MHFKALSRLGSWKPRKRDEEETCTCLCSRKMSSAHILAGWGTREKPWKHTRQKTLNHSTTFIQQPQRSVVFLSSAQSCRHSHQRNKKHNRSWKRAAVFNPDVVNITVITLRCLFAPPTCGRVFSFPFFKNNKLKQLESMLRLLWTINPVCSF